MSIAKRIYDWLCEDTVEKEFKKFFDSHAKLIKIRLEFSNGLIRELDGEQANEWNKDLFLGLSGKYVDWKRHDWKQSFISKGENNG